MTSNEHKYYKGYETLQHDLVIYTNPETKKPWYYARIKLRLNKGYIRRSLKTTDQEQAKRLAWDLYRKLKEDEYFGVVSKKVYLSQITNAYMKTKGPKLSKWRLDQIERWTRRYIIPWFGNATLDQIIADQDKIDRYPLYRMDYWDVYEAEVASGIRIDEREKVNKGGYKALNKDEKRPYTWKRNRPARSTVLAELRLFNALMKFAKEKKWIAHDVTMSQSNLPTTPPVRQAMYTFTDDEISKLRTYFQQQTKNNKTLLFDQDGEPLLTSDGTQAYRLFATASDLQRRLWINLRVSFFLQLNCGLRTSEIHSLKWSSITQSSTTTTEGKEFSYLALRVFETKSERRHLGHRIVYCPIHMSKLLNEVRQANAPHNKDSDYVFCNSKGNQYKILNRRFKQLLQRLDIYKSPEGTTRDRGHLRSYWMSKALRTKPIHVVAAAAGNSIQTAYNFYCRLEIAKEAYKVLHDIRQPDNIVSLLSLEELGEETT